MIIRLQVGSTARRNLQNFDLDLEWWGLWAWFHPFDIFDLNHCFIWTSIISSGAVVITSWLEVVTSSRTSASRAFRLAWVRVMNCPIQLSWIQDLVSQRFLLLITHLVCALRSYPEPLVSSICNHETKLGLRLVQSAPYALLMCSSPWPSKDLQTDICLFTQPSDWSVPIAC